MTAETSAAPVPDGTTPSSADAPSPPAVRVRDLVRTYPHPDGGRLHAVAGVSFEVRRGEVFALLGPNGAGKTTTLEILEGLTEPTAGTAEVLGLDVRRDRETLKRRVGVQLQASSYFEHLTLREILVLFGSFYPTRRDPDELLELVGLTAKRTALVSQLSGGQAQRFSIVAALVNDPEVIFLDEPTTGLDPQARRNLWDLIRTIHAAGHTVVLTTHYLEEAELLADRVAIMDHGRLIALDTPAGHITTLGSQHRLRFRLDEHVASADLIRLAGVREVSVDDAQTATCDLTVDDPQQAVPALFAWAERAGTRLTDVRITAPTLEDVFLALTGHRLRD